MKSQTIDSYQFRATGLKNKTLRISYNYCAICGHTPQNDQTTAENKILKSIAMVAKFGEVLTASQKEANDWKKRMIVAGLGNRGLDMPENWDQLPEAEKTRRLDGALQAISA